MANCSSARENVRCVSRRSRNLALQHHRSLSIARDLLQEALVDLSLLLGFIGRSRAGSLPIGPGDLPVKVTTYYLDLVLSPLSPVEVLHRPVRPAAAILLLCQEPPDLPVQPRTHRPEPLELVAVLHLYRPAPAPAGPAHLQQVCHQVCCGLVCTLGPQ